MTYPRWSHDSRYAGLFAVTILATFGCVHYQPERIDPAATARHLAHRSLTDPGLKSFIEMNAQEPPVEWPPPVWGLTDLTLAAFYFHPDLDVARVEWAVARAGQRTVRQRPDPAVSVGSGRNSTTRVPSPWILTGMVDLTIETAGKRRARQDRARHQADAARLKIAAVAWKVRSRTRESLAALQTALETGRLLERQQALQDENVRRTEQRYAAGAVSAFERAQVRLAAEQSRLALSDADRQAEEARARLAAATGVPVEALEGISLSYDELDTVPDEATLEEASTQALMNRADLLVALAEYAASEASLRLEIANQYPDIHIGPGYEFDQGDNKWALGLNVSLPIFSRNRGPIAEAEARRAEAAARFEALQFGVLHSVAQAMAAYRASQNKMVVAEAIQAELLVQVKRAEELLAAGEFSEADLVAVRLEMSSVALSHRAALYEMRQALGALEDALQIPLGFPSTFWQNAPRAAPEQDKDS